MYCPKCGQAQAVDEARFCPRCGFTLGFVSELVANNGMLPTHLVPNNPAARELSARRKGVRQGGTLVLVGMALVPILALIVAMTGLDTEIILTGVILLIAGLARMLYAAMFEEGVPAGPALPTATHAAAPLFNPIPQNASLPPRQTPTPASFRRRDTAELVAPPASVTENTTRLLDGQADATKH
jgi:hypothetical protein